jgi:hypothetical protein
MTMTTCNAIREELVAYCDGELSEAESHGIAAHLATCAECAREEAQVRRMQALFVQAEKLTRIEPSPNFAATFWQRVEQENTQARPVVVKTPSVAAENRWLQWWNALRETFTAWQLAPVLAATASVLVFFSYLLTPMRTPTSTPSPTSTTVVTKAASPAAPADLIGNLNFFLHYSVVADLERFVHFEEIAAVDLSEEHGNALAKEDELPPDLLQNPNFFAHYPLLQKMEQMEHLEAVLETPVQENEHEQG